MAYEASTGMFIDSFFNSLEHVLNKHGVQNVQGILDDLDHTVRETGLLNAIRGHARNCDEIIKGRFFKHDRTDRYLNRPELVSQLEREIYSLRALLSTEGIDRSSRVLNSLFKVDQKPGGSSTIIYCSMAVQDKLRQGAFKVGDLKDQLIQENMILTQKVTDLEDALNKQTNAHNAEAFLEIENVIEDVENGYAVIDHKTTEVFEKQAAEIARLHCIIEKDDEIIITQTKEMKRLQAKIAELEEKVKTHTYENDACISAQMDTMKVRIAHMQKVIREKNERISDAEVTIAELRERIHKLRLTVEECAAEINWRKTRDTVYKLMADGIDTLTKYLNLQVEYGDKIDNTELEKVASVLAGLTVIVTNS